MHPSHSQGAFPNPTCPLCGSPNECALASTGDITAPCWCRDLTFTPGILAKAAQCSDGTACICRPCAEQALWHDRVPEKT